MEEAAAASAVVPAGFRFLPTDWEILNYLREEQMTAESLRLGFIRYIDLYAVEPWKLWEWFSVNDDHHIIHGGTTGGGGGGDDQEEDYGEYQDYLYFFTPLKKKTKNGTNIDRTVVVKGGGAEGQGSSVPVGTWKPQSKPINIIDSRTRIPMGVKKQITFVPSTKMEDNEDDNSSSGCSSSSSSSKKRKHAPEEMEGISYIMHEYTLCPSDNQIYSLCRIRRKIDKKIIIKKKMRRSSSPTTNTTTSTVVQTVQEERAAGYDHHQQENNNICYNDGQQQQQQQQAVLPPEEDVQISDGDKGLANAMEADILFHGVVLNEEFLSRLEQDVAARAATTTGGDLLYYGNDRYDDNHQEVMNNARVSDINIHPHVQISDDDKKSAQEIEEDLELPAAWRQGATAEELGFFNIEDLLRSCH